MSTFLLFFFFPLPIRWIYWYSPKGLELDELFPSLKRWWRWAHSRAAVEKKNFIPRAQTNSLCVSVGVSCCMDAAGVIGPWQNITNAFGKMIPRFNILAMIPKGMFFFFTQDNPAQRSQNTTLQWSMAVVASHDGDVFLQLELLRQGREDFEQFEIAVSVSKKKN